MWSPTPTPPPPRHRVAARGRGPILRALVFPPPPRERTQAVWRQGNSLPQSLFVCLYLHRPALDALAARVGCSSLFGPVPAAGAADSAPSPAWTPYPVGSRAHTAALVLLAYCASVLRTVLMDNRLIVDADLYEEEDAVVDTHGVDLLPAVADRDVMLLLRDAEAALCASVCALRPAAGAGASGASALAPKRGVKKWKAGKLSSVGVTVGIEPVSTATAALPADSPLSPLPAVPFEPLVDGGDSVANMELADALTERLRFRRCYLMAQLQTVAPHSPPPLFVSLPVRSRVPLPPPPPPAGPSPAARLARGGGVLGGGTGGAGGRHRLHLRGC